MNVMSAAEAIWLLECQEKGTPIHSLETPTNMSEKYPGFTQDKHSFKMPMLPLRTFCDISQMLTTTSSLDKGNE